MKEVNTVDEIVKIVCDNMDATMKKYSQGRLPPQVLTDDKEVTSILAGMGLVEFSQDNDKVIIKSKTPVTIYWNGRKFEVISKQSWK